MDIPWLLLTLWDFDAYARQEGVTIGTGPHQCGQEHKGHLQVRQSSTDSGVCPAGPRLLLDLKAPPVVGRVHGRAGTAED